MNMCVVFSIHVHAWVYVCMCMYIRRSVVFVTVIFTLLPYFLPLLLLYYVTRERKKQLNLHSWFKEKQNRMSLYCTWICANVSFSFIQKNNTCLCVCVCLCKCTQFIRNIEVQLLKGFSKKQSTQTNTHFVYKARWRWQQQRQLKKRRQKIPDIKKILCTCNGLKRKQWAKIQSKSSATVHVIDGGNMQSLLKKNSTIATVDDVVHTLSHQFYYSMDE